MPAKNQPERLDLTSHDIAADKQAELLRLFPEARTEGGQIDFERLKLALGETVDAGRERYGMTWPGKADCFKTIQAPSLGTLLPAPDESVDFDTTENLIIEGDNLEALKLLQKAYVGKVKMIYIDPPYNTGNDFIYPDNYTESLQTYLEYTGQVDAEGRKYSTNSDTDGRFHSRWLNMMYPRLYLARNLLREDGVIFVSMDDGEVKNLRALCDELFGEENFLACIAWEKRYTRSNNARLFYSLKDNVVLYRKSDQVTLLREPRSEKSDEHYDNPDSDPRGPWSSASYVNPATKEERRNLVYGIKNPHTGVIVEHPTHAWKYELSEHQRHVEEGRLWWGKSGDAKYPRLKLFLSEQSEGLVPIDLWHHTNSGTTDEGGLELKSIFGEAIFDNPKPTRLIRRMLGLTTSTNEGHIILDFFAGSGTTAQAVLEQNKQDGGNRKFILVQLPEPTGREDYPTIADITKERIRRVIQKLNDEETGQLPLHEKQDRGFRVFKLAESNFKGWEATVPTDGKALAQQLELHIDHIREGRGEQDILFEILLKSGFALTTPVEELELAGVKVYAVGLRPTVEFGNAELHAGEGGMLVCLAQKLTLEAIRAMAERGPQRVVCLDAGFAGDDPLKTNAVQIFKTKEIVFKTV